MAYPLDPQDERDVVDQIALVFEHSGYPPVTSRLLGYLMICDPPEQSSQELADYLIASKGAISQSTRMLMQTGLVERVRVRGSRSAYFRMKDNAWHKVIAEEVARVRRLKDVAAAGLKILAGTPDSRRRRLQEFHDMNALFEREFPKLIELWDQQMQRRTP